jgi:hypothetical protein
LKTFDLHSRERLRLKVAKRASDLRGKYVQSFKTSLWFHGIITHMMHNEFSKVLSAVLKSETRTKKMKLTMNPTASFAVAMPTCCTAIACARRSHPTLEY